MREYHDDVRDGKGEEHKEDVEVDETKPVQEGFPVEVNAVSGGEWVRLLGRCGAVGWG